MTPPVQMALPFATELAGIEREVDETLKRARAAGDPLIATDYGNQLSQSIELKGVALARLFLGMRNDWELYRAAGITEDFPDFVDAHMRVRGSTAVKYANMYEAVFVQSGVSPIIQNYLSQKPIESLLLLTAAVREGSIDAEQLEDVVVLGKDGIRSMVKTARGDATSSKSAAYARLVQRKHSVYPPGTIVAFGGDGNSEAIGSLKLEPQTEAGGKIVNRIINRLGLEDIR